MLLLFFFILPGLTYQAMQVNNQKYVSYENKLEKKNRLFDFDKSINENNRKPSRHIVQYFYYEVPIFLGSHEQCTPALLEFCSGTTVAAASYMPSNSNTTHHISHFTSHGASFNHIADEIMFLQEEEDFPGFIIQDFQFLHNLVDDGYSILGLGPQRSGIIDCIYREEAIKEPSFSLIPLDNGGVDLKIGKPMAENFPDNFVQFNYDCDAESNLNIKLDSMTIGTETWNVNETFNLDSSKPELYLPEEMLKAIDRIFDVYMEPGVQNPARIVSCYQPSHRVIKFTFGEKDIRVPFDKLIFKPAPGVCTLKVSPTSGVPILGHPFFSQVYFHANHAESSFYLAQVNDLGTDYDI